MRHIIIAILLLASINSMAQSKKELAAQIESLKKENQKLQNDIAELKKPKPVILNDTIQKVSYSLGSLLAGNIKRQGADSIKLDAVAAGFKDIYSGADLQVPEEEGMQLVQAYMQKVALLRTQRMRAEGELFLANNKKQPGVITTASGLQYKVNTAGTGKTPKANDKVTVNYTGKLVDGTVFDSSIARNEPATFEVSGIIEGWTEALQLMHEGDKWTIYIPSELGYGDQGAGTQIPPYAPLIFDVELIKVN